MRNLIKKWYYKLLYEKKEEKFREKIVIYIIWIENELNICVFLNVNLNMIYIRYMCKISWFFFKRVVIIYNI